MILIWLGIIDEWIEADTAKANTVVAVAVAVENIRHDCSSGISLISGKNIFENP